MGDKYVKNLIGVFIEIESFRILLWFNNLIDSDGWDYVVCLYVGLGLVWKLCCLGRLFYLIFLVMMKLLCFFIGLIF